MVRLTDTLLAILSAASQREDRGVERPANFQGKAAGKIVDKLIRAGFLEEVRASGSLPVWRRDNENGEIGLCITKAGLAAVDAADEAMAAPEEKGGRLISLGEVAKSGTGAIASGKQRLVSQRQSTRARHRLGKEKIQTGVFPDSRAGASPSMRIAASWFGSHWPTEYKHAARWTRADGRLPSDRPQRRCVPSACSVPPCSRQSRTSPSGGR